MNFRTALPPFRSSIGLSHTDRTLCTGSCFAEEMGGRLQRLKFPSLVNPFGIVFDPVSIARGLERLLSGGPYGEADLFEHQGLWHSFEHHGRFSQPDSAATLDGINRAFSASQSFLKTANRLIVTLGTAHVFTFPKGHVGKTGEVVANCHKLPGGEFGRRRLAVAEVEAALGTIFEKMRAALPGIEVIATVSPVRHLRDGLPENQRSKATLLLALDGLCQRLPYLHYFPAYELLLDDLRDYRFYAEDMAHPSPQATDYIWQHFEGAFFDEKTRALCQTLAELQRAVCHRPLHPQSVEHQAFAKRQADAVRALAAEHPHLDFGAELRHFEGG